MHRRLGSTTLSQLTFPRESDPNFPWEKSQWDNTVLTQQLFCFSPDVRARDNKLPVIALLAASHRPRKQRCCCRCFLLTFACYCLSGYGDGRGDVVQLLEHRTGTPPMQVRFPGAARDFSPRVNCQCRLSHGVPTPPPPLRVPLRALTSVRTLKIP